MQDSLLKKYECEQTGWEEYFKGCLFFAKGRSVELRDKNNICGIVFFNFEAGIIYLKLVFGKCRYVCCSVYITNGMHSEIRFPEY